MNPKVSIVIPVYNTEKYLDRCIESLKKQTLEEIEVILVDDGSKEACASLCDEIAKTDSRIKVIHKKNAGAGFARNTGLAVATGQYVGFVDSDDYVEHTMYEKLYDAAVRNDADFVLSGYCFVGGNTYAEDGQCTQKPLFREETLFENEKVKDLLLGTVGALPNEPEDSRYGVGVWKNIFRNALLQEKKIQFPSERKFMSEDALFLVDYLKCIERAVGIPGTYYCYCRNEDSVSKSYNRERFEKCIVFLKEMEKKLEDSECKEGYKIYLDRLTQGYGRVLCSQEVVYARENNIKFAALKSRLQEICTRDEMRAVLKTYPWYKLPIKQAAFAFAMKYKLYRLQKLLVMLRQR